MKTNYDYVQGYLDAYKAMREHATKVIKNYGKTLDIEEILQARVMKEKGWTIWPAYGSEESNSIEEEVEEWKYNEMYWCAFTDKHGRINDGYISKVRWNAEHERIEIFFNSDEGDVSEWLPESYIDFDRDAIFQTILAFIH